MGWRGALGDLWGYGPGRLRHLHRKGPDPGTGTGVCGVRHQRFWFQRPRKLGEYLTHLVDSIMRRVCGVASAGFQVFCV